MLHPRKKLSRRQTFWLGFACCPLITWASFAGIVLLTLYGDRFSVLLPRNLPLLTGSVSLASIIAYLCVIPTLSGFCTAFFWHHLLPGEGPESSAGLWSLILAWTPLVLFTGVWVLVLSPLTTAFYYLGLLRSYNFWNTRRHRQWFGDFSDLGPTESAE